MHIKKENIGLIEVMGLAVLPARLKGELGRLSEFILDGKDIRADEELSKHADWVDEIKASYSDINSSNIEEILQQELEDAGVYKMNDEGMEAFKRFISTL